ncbi:hypothetical protein [Acidovorax sp.]|uniref:hypothetical protein n=1 Tax=Acidovorax sp. TaxID=1872122 RepID=UPI00391FC9FA
MTMTKNSQRIAFAIAFSACLASLAGCVSSSTSRVTVQEGVKFSKGRELDDLVRAYDAHAMTRSEYEELRQVIMKRPN